MAAILDLDDWLLSVQVDGQLVYRQPAIALDTGSGIVFGERAASASRTQPRQVSATFVSRLSGEPLASPFHSARNHADVLYQQLRQLAASIPALTTMPVLVLVRGAITPDQLGLFLGVAGECGMRVGAFVDRVVASLASLGERGDLVCLELGADSGELGTIRIDDMATRQHVRDFPGQGLSQLLDGWANVIADHFIRDTRFDPLHAAATEQQLYDAVRAWFAAGRPDESISIDHQGEIRRLDVQRDALTTRLHDRVQPLLREVSPGQTLVLGPNAATTPLLAGLLRNAGCNLLIADHGAMLTHVEARAAGLLDPDEVRLYTSLPAAAPGVGAAAGARAASATTLATPNDASASSRTRPASGPRAVHLPGRPTHGLHGAVAYAIGSEELPAEAVAPAYPVGTALEVAGRLFTLIEVRP